MLSSTMSNEHIFSSSSVCTSIPANLNNFIGIMVERTQLLSFVSHNLLKKELTAYLLLPGKIYNLSGIRSIILPPQDLNLSALPSVPIIWTIRTSRQISKKTEATSNVDAVPFSHTRARILQYDINPASFIKDFPLKRWMPYYYSMRISRLMQTMLFRNFFNFLFPVLSSPSGFAAGLFIFFPSSFLFPALLFSSLCLVYFSSL